MWYAERLFNAVDRLRSGPDEVDHDRRWGAHTRVAEWQGKHRAPVIFELRAPARPDGVGPRAVRAWRELVDHHLTILQQKHLHSKRANAVDGLDGSPSDVHRLHG